MGISEFSELLHQIVDAGATPTIVCECGHLTFMYEGSTKDAYDRFDSACGRCGSIEKTLLGDFRENMI